LRASESERKFIKYSQSPEDRELNVRCLIKACEKDQCEGARAKQKHNNGSAQVDQRRRLRQKFHSNRVLAVMDLQKESSLGPTNLKMAVVQVSRLHCNYISTYYITNVTMLPTD
jgi:hypothetical protein